MRADHRETSRFCPYTAALHCVQTRLAQMVCNSKYPYLRDVLNCSLVGLAFVNHWILPTWKATCISCLSLATQKWRYHLVFGQPGENFPPCAWPELPKSHNWARLSPEKCRTYKNDMNQSVFYTACAAMFLMPLSVRGEGVGRGFS